MKISSAILELLYADRQTAMPKELWAFLQYLFAKNLKVTTQNSPQTVHYLDSRFINYAVMAVAQAVA